MTLLLPELAAAGPQCLLLSPGLRRRWTVQARSGCRRVLEPLKEARCRRGTLGGHSWGCSGEGALVWGAPRATLGMGRRVEPSHQEGWFQGRNGEEDTELGGGGTLVPNQL